jgi:hypothetical protein
LLLDSNDRLAQLGGDVLPGLSRVDRSERACSGVDGYRASVLDSTDVDDSVGR